MPVPPLARYRDRQRPGNRSRNSQTRAVQRRTAPHPDPTGNGGPRNGDYVRLGGAERGPPPPPTTRSRALIPRALPPLRERQSNRGSPNRSTSPAPAPDPGRERPSAAGPTQRDSGVLHGLRCRPPAPSPSSTGVWVPKLRNYSSSDSICLATARSLQYHQEDCGYTLREMAEVGEGKPGNVPSRSTGQPPSSPQTPPSSGKIGLQPSTPRAASPAPLLTARGRRPQAAAPPQPVTARQRTSAGPRRPPPPPRTLLPRRRADWLPGLQRWREDEAIGPRPRQSRRRRRRRPASRRRLPLGSKAAKGPEKKPGLEKVHAAFRKAKPVPESIIPKPQQP